MARWVLYVALLALVPSNLLAARDICSDIAKPNGETHKEPIPRKGYCRYYCQCSKDRCYLKRCRIWQWFDPVTESCKTNGRNCDWYQQTTTPSPTTTVTTPATTTTSTTPSTTTTVTTPATTTTSRKPSSTSTTPSTTTTSTTPSTTTTTTTPSTTTTSTTPSTTTTSTTPSTTTTSTTPSTTRPTTTSMTPISAGRSRCEKPSTVATSPKPSSCPPSGNIMIPSAGDCSKYIYCNYGYAWLMDCPVGLLFHYDAQLCDWPECKDC